MKKILFVVASFLIALPVSAFSVSVPTATLVDEAVQNTSQGCLVLKYNMGYRSRDAATNGQVSDLQDFLAAQGYFGSEPTGYFGIQTVAAVKKFQLATGLATRTTPGYGGVGAKTRAKIKEMTCGVVTSVSTASTTNTSTEAVTPVLPIGCDKGYKYSYVTGLACVTTPVITPEPTPTPIAPKYSCNGIVSNFLCLPPAPVTTPVVKAPSVEFLSAPVLTLEYDGLGNESRLVAKAKVKVTAGSEQINFAANPEVLFGNFLSFSNLEAKGITTIGMSSKVSTSSGSLNPIPANTSVTVEITKYAPTKELFAGTYRITSGQLGYFDAANTYRAFPIESTTNISSSNTITIIGETSPYITNIEIDASSKIGGYRIFGIRFNSASNSVVINGIAKILPALNRYSAVDGSLIPNSDIPFNPKDFGITKNGNYMIQVINPTTGAGSNRVYSIINISEPTVEFVGIPTLTLEYDSLGKESKLLGKAKVKITAGGETMSFGTNANGYFGGLLKLTSSETAVVITNGMTTATKLFEGSSLSSIPANTSVTVEVTKYAPTKELFAGTYRITPGGAFGYLNTANTYQAIGTESYINPQSSNSVTIIGETSPYISGVTVTSDGVITVKGVRLNQVGDQIVVDGNIIIGGTKGDETTLSFWANTYGISSGSHIIQINNSQTGDSSRVSFMVPVPATSPTVEFVDTPTLALEYDALGKESRLVGKAKVKITAGGESMNFWGTPRGAFGTLLRFVSPKYSEGLITLGMTSDVINLYGTSSLDTIPANTSVTVEITKYVPTKELFSETYKIAPIGYFNYSNTNHGYYTIQPESYINPQLSNPVTIIGETSPYITTITKDPTSSGYIINGVRFESTGNKVSVNGNVVTLSSFNNKTAIRIYPTAFGMTTAGNYLVIVTSPTTGESNKVWLNFVPK